MRHGEGGNPKAPRSNLLAISHFIGQFINETKGKRGLGKHLIINHTSYIAHNSKDRGSGLKLWGIKGLRIEHQPKTSYHNKQVAFISGISFFVQQYLLNLDFNGAKTNPRLPQIEMKLHNLSIRNNRLEV